MYLLKINYLEGNLLYTSTIGNKKSFYVIDDNYSGLTYWIIDNEGTLDDLATSAEFFLKNFEKGIKKRSKNIDD